MAVLLNDLATVSNFVEAKSGRRPFQEVAEAGQFVQVLLVTGRAGGCQFRFECYSGADSLGKLVLVMLKNL